MKKYNGQVFARDSRGNGTLIEDFENKRKNLNIISSLDGNHQRGNYYELITTGGVGETPIGYVLTKDLEKIL